MDLCVLIVAFFSSFFENTAYILRKTFKETLYEGRKNEMRSSGILLAITSLPSRFGIGTLGEGAFGFVDFLSKSGQYYWQILPVNPPGYGNSPYQAHSAFAGNPFLIDPQALKNDGLLSERETEALLAPEGKRVDYSLMNAERLGVLKKAAERTDEKSGDFKNFEEENAFWLDDYCDYMALREKNSMNALSEWTDLEFDARAALTHKKLQFLFFRQWDALKAYANKSGVHIIGDLPIYVAHDSADFFAHRSLFLTDEEGKPDFVAGCPPDAFSPLGQLWGNPIYNWEKMEQDDFFWWKKRFSMAQKMFDVVRIDHFRGFFEYYRVPSGADNAVIGEWKKGPGLKFVEEIKKDFPKLGIIAEDLGFLTEETRRFFKKSGFPGMKVLQFAFDEQNSEYLPHNHVKNAVVYTGTHDNPTTRQWQCTAKNEVLRRAMDYLGASSAEELCSAFIRAAFSSCCKTAIIPIQDWLKKGGASRMNTPGTVNNNWEFRVRESELSERLSQRILNYTLLFSRKQEEQK